MQITKGSDLCNLLHGSNLFENFLGACSSTHRREKVCENVLKGTFPNSHDLPLLINGKITSFQHMSFLCALKQRLLRVIHLVQL